MDEIIDRRSATWIAWKLAAKYRARRTLEAAFTIIKIALFISLCSSAGTAAGLSTFYAFKWLIE